MTTHTTWFGSTRKNITCRCNAEEAETMDCDVRTIQMNSRCPVCNSSYLITIPRSVLRAAYQKKQEVSRVQSEPRLPMPATVDAFLSSEWVSGVLAL
jgi:hypothetical protein